MYIYIYIYTHGCRHTHKHSFLCICMFLFIVMFMVVHFFIIPWSKVFRVGRTQGAGNPQRVSAEPRRPGCGMLRALLSRASQGLGSSS